MGITFKRLYIFRGYGGELSGTLEVEGGSGKVELNLTDSMCSKILGVCADDIVNSATRDVITSHLLVDTIRDSNRILDEQDPVEIAAIAEEAMERINVGRHGLEEEILARAAELAPQYGIELIDVRIKRINYVEEVRKKVYERMISERKRAAEQYRSEGQGEASKILGNKERDLKEIESGAFKTAQEINGEADAKATAIYAAAYNRNAETRDFYRFLKTMETYETALSEKDWLILSTQSDFFKFLRNQSGR